MTDPTYGCLYGPGGPMRPDQLTDGDRRAVDLFRRYLACELDVDPRTGEYVDRGARHDGDVTSEETR